MSIRSVYGPSNMRDIWGYESNGNEYALVCLGDRLEIVNCTDPDNVFLTQTVFTTSGDLKDVKVYQNYAYAVNQFGPSDMDKSAVNKSLKRAIGAVYRPASRTRWQSSGSMISCIASFTAAGDPGMVKTTVCSSNPPVARLNIAAAPICS